MNQAEKNMDIAKIILSQLGGIRALRVMTGAKNFVAIENGVVFKMAGRNAPGKGNIVRVVLNSRDLYDITVSTQRKYTLFEKYSATGIYADMLRECVEEATGRYLTVPTIQFVGA